MMKHKEIQKKLLRYLDDELPQEERSEIQNHLERCEQCRQDIDLLSGAWNLSQPIKRSQPSPFLWNKISARLDSKAQKGQLIHKAVLFIRQMAQPALTAAVVILGLFIGINLGDRMITAQLSNQQTAITTTQSQSEFGLENFRVLSSSSLGSELAALMDYKK